MNCSLYVNGDSYEDVIIGAPEYNNNAGRAYVVYGSQSLPPNIPAWDVNIILDAGSPGDRFGYSVGGADLGGDGFSDLLVGAPFNDTLNGSLLDAGTVYVFNGSVNLNGTLQGANFTRSGENAFDHFGWSVGIARDIKLENYTYILTGAPYFDNVSLQDVGKVYILATVMIPEFELLFIPIILIFVMITIAKRLAGKKKNK